MPPHHMSNPLAAGQQQEQDLIVRLRTHDGDRHTLFEKLIGEHTTAVRHRCQAYLKNPQDAADAAQETLLRAYRAIDRFRGGSSLRTWLFAIADNECHTLARKRSRHLVTPGFDSGSDPLQGSDHDERVEQSDDTELVHWALQRISPNSRDVLHLRYFADLSINELALRLNISLSAAKMRLYRAQGKMARVLVGQEFASLHSEPPTQNTRTAGVG